jgi:hypothetical protein
MFAILSLRNGMDVLHLQNLGGWEDLEMVRHYAQMVDEDLFSLTRHIPPLITCESVFTACVLISCAPERTQVLPMKLTNKAKYRLS